MNDNNISSVNFSSNFSLLQQNNETPQNSTQENQSLYYTPPSAEVKTFPKKRFKFIDSKLSQTNLGNNFNISQTNATQVPPKESRILSNALGTKLKRKIENDETIIRDNSESNRFKRLRKDQETQSDNASVAFDSQIHSASFSKQSAMEIPDEAVSSLSNFEKIIPITDLYFFYPPSMGFESKSKKEKEQERKDRAFKTKEKEKEKLDKIIADIKKNNCQNISIELNDLFTQHRKTLVIDGVVLCNIGLIIKNCPTITKVGLPRISIEPRFGFDEYLKRSNVTHLSIRGNSFASFDLKTGIFKHLVGSKITHLDLSNCIANKNLTNAISDYSDLKKTNIKYLNFSEMPKAFKEKEGAEFLLELIRVNPQLIEIDLTNTKLPDDFEKEILKILPKTNLQVCLFKGQNLCKKAYLRQGIENSENEKDFSSVAPGRTFDCLHYFIYDLNLDAIPAILKCFKNIKKGDYNVLNPTANNCLPLKITVIKPTDYPSYNSINNDGPIDKKLVDLAKNNKEIEFDSINEKDLHKVSSANLSELRIYIGETVNCGLTSNIRKGKLGNTGQGEDELSQYHLNHLKKIKDHISPDIILSENHSFPSFIENRISEILNGENHENDDYYIQYEKVQHGAYTQEMRTRIYLVASKRFIKAGTPAAVSVKSHSQVPSILDIAQEEDVREISSIPTQNNLLEDIMTYYSAVLSAGMSDDNVKLESHHGILTLVHNGEKYWLNISPNNQVKYGIKPESFVFFNSTSGDIRIVKREQEDRDSSWIQSRFYYDSNHRVCKTITSLDFFGTNTWSYGAGCNKLSTYTVARVHGCTKSFSKLIEDNYKEIKRPNAGNQYIGHAYSSKVVSHLLLSSIWKFSRMNSNYVTQDYPTQTHYAKGNLNEILDKISTHHKENFFLDLKEEYQDEIFIVDKENNLPIPEMKWVKITPKIESQLKLVESLDNQKEGFSEDTIKLNDYLEANRHRLVELLDEVKKDYNLYPHQLDGIQWLINQRLGKKGSLLADDMGLGKTIQSVMYILLIRACAAKACSLPRPIMVVLPKRLVKGWKKELKNLVDNPKDVVKVLQSEKDLEELHLMNENSGQIVFDNIFIATNEFIRNYSNNIQDIPFDTIILDEAQKIRNSSSILSQNLKSLDANARICLSATPLENSVGDLINILHFIDPEFPIKIKNNYSKEDVVSLQKHLEKYMLRRRKDQINLGLPEKELKTIVLEPTTLQKKVYDFVNENEQNERNKKIVKITNSILVCNHPLTLNDREQDKLKEILNAEEIREINSTKFPKINKIIELLKERYPNGYQIDKDKPTVIFSSYIKMLNLISKYIADSGIFKTKEVKVVDGKMNQKDFDQIISKFNKGSIPVLLINLKQGQGLNLQVSDTAILVEPWWNPQLEKQAEDRIYRIGQKSNVTILKLKLADTIEMDLISPKQKNKIDLFDKLVNNSSENFDLDSAMEELLVPNSQNLKEASDVEAPYEFMIDPMDIDWNEKDQGVDFEEDSNEVVI